VAISQTEEIFRLSQTNFQSGNLVNKKKLLHMICSYNCISSAVGKIMLEKCIFSLTKPTTFLLFPNCSLTNFEFPGLIRFQDFPEMVATPIEKLTN